jgi:hypothetical protein
MYDWRTIIATETTIETETRIALSTLKKNEDDDDDDQKHIQADRRLKIYINQ